MTIRHKNFSANTQLLASEVQNLADNGVVQISSASDLTNADLDDVNMVYQTDINKVRIRISPGTGSVNWGNPFSEGASPAVASGGTESTYTGNGTNGINGQAYKVHTFTSGSATLNVSKAGLADLLIIGGGGGGGTAAGGGAYAGGGGGAGGVLVITDAWLCRASSFLAGRLLDDRSLSEGVDLDEQTAGDPG